MHFLKAKPVRLENWQDNYCKFGSLAQVGTLGFCNPVI
jgi:hypothetical protein